jgi:imidazolonepropionase-like amidohydrolase
MAERGTQAIPTLIPYAIIFDVWGGYFGSTSRRFAFSKDDNLKMLRRLRQGGVKIGVGTDIVMDWFRYLPYAYIQEIRFLTMAGYSVPEALEAATRVNAEILDMGDKLGTLEPGKLADILVVEGKPDETLDDLQNVKLVIRDGHVIVKDGRIHVPRHEGRLLPEPGGGQKGPWY